MLGKGPVGTAIGAALLGGSALYEGMKNRPKGKTNPKTTKVRRPGKAHTIKTTNQRGQPVTLTANRYDGSSSPKKPTGTPKTKRPSASTSKKPVKKVGPLSPKRGVKRTKGGDYPIYKKKSAEAGSFRHAFAAARKTGKKTFTWRGRKYNTKVKK